MASITAQWLNELLQDYQEAIPVQLFDEIVHEVEKEASRANTAEAALKPWKELIQAAHVKRETLHPDNNNWPPEVKWIAHCLHSGSIPPSEDAPVKDRRIPVFYYVIHADADGNLDVEAMLDGRA